MKRNFSKLAALSLVFGALVIPTRADWLNYVVRTSGLAWSDGYHAYDQCPPKKHCHQHPFALPGYGNWTTPAAEPYYFELNNHQPAGMLPPPPTEAAPKSMLPNPQAQYRPQSRYFQAIEQSQSQQLQARQPGAARPY